MAREREPRADSAPDRGAERESREPNGNIIEQALEAHELRADQCLGMAERNGEAILVTRGGQKIRWRPGQPPVEIPAHQHPDAKPKVKARKK